MDSLELPSVKTFTDTALATMARQVAGHLRVLHVTWKALGYEVLDLGPCNTNPVDFPDYAEAVGLAIQRG